MKLRKRTWSQLPILRISGTQPMVTPKSPAYRERIGRAPKVRASKANPSPVCKSTTNAKTPADRHVSVRETSASSESRPAVPRCSGQLVWELPRRDHPQSSCTCNGKYLFSNIEVDNPRAGYCRTPGSKFQRFQDVRDLAISTLDLKFEDIWQSFSHLRIFFFHLRMNTGMV